MRVGRRFKRMARKLPEGEATLLWNNVNAKTVYDGFAELFKVKEGLKKRIEERALYVLEKARQGGEKARHTWHKCGDSSCAICGGGTGAEHLHFSVEGKKDVNLEEWLANYLSAEEVLGFVSVIKNRENLLVVLHYQTILLKNLGLLED